MQGWYRDADVENRHVDGAGAEGGMIWETGVDVRAQPPVRETASGSCHRAQGAQSGAL